MNNKKITSVVLKKLGNYRDRKRAVKKAILFTINEINAEIKKAIDKRINIIELERKETTIYGMKKQKSLDIFNLEELKQKLGVK